MKHVRLTLDAGGREAEIHPMYDLLANAEFVERAETTHVNFADDGLGIMHYVEGDREAFAAALEDIEDVHAYELTRTNESGFYAYLHCSPGGRANAMFGALYRGRLIHVPPTEYRPDGTVAVSLIGTADEIEAAIEAVEEQVDVTVDEITGVDRATGTARSLLSDRQRAALEAALELGYYEIPREASHEDVAEALGCAPSTAAEHLRKAESKVLRSVFERAATPAAPSR